MQLEDLQAELRPRTSFESMDLGARMLQRWWRPTLGAWVLVVGPIFLLTFGLMWWAPWLAAFLLWCAQPLWDRVVLQVISRALFGATPTLKETLREVPSLMLRDWPGAFFDRFDPTRSLSSPVRQLEGLKGSAGSRRKSQLRARGAGAATLLALSCWSMEMLVGMGVVALVFLVLPQTPNFTELLWADLADLQFPAWLQIVFVVAWFTAHTLIEPFYVAAGFGLYLNRRTRLEGWDVEIQFRQLARRLARVGVTGAALLLLFGTPGRAQAQETLPPSQAVEQVLQDPDFDTTELRTEWQRKEGQPLLEWLEGCAEQSDEVVEPLPQVNLEPVSVGIQGLLWGLMAVGLALLVLMLFRSDGGRLAGALERPLPESRAGVSGPAERLLPPNLPQVARELWEQGQHALAVGLLYQGAVADLVRRGLPIDEGATERECLRVARRQLQGESLSYFRDLTRVWQILAYAHRGVSPEKVEPLLAGWSLHFNEDIS